MTNGFVGGLLFQGSPGDRQGDRRPKAQVDGLAGRSGGPRLRVAGGIIAEMSHPGRTVRPMAPSDLLTDEERRVICAGVLPDPQRTEIWMANRAAVTHLVRLGFMRRIEPVGADGRSSISAPAELTDAGIKLARELGCFGRR